ncbi:MAG: RsmB/NOP family class I SAM-dependent RNA methyltransferase [Nanoarchaeota archaeon]
MKTNPTQKPEFTERMKKLLSPSDYEKFEEILKIFPIKSLRVNTLKISPENLKKRLEEKNWKITQIWPKHPEVMVVEGKFSDNNLIDLEPGELGRALEHLLGYYYIQELASMLPVIALEPKLGEMILDLCASPGSKTTQIASCMQNTGTILANEISYSRIKILASNLERCGVTNTIITKKEGVALCIRLKKSGILFDRILIDAPCSGEGTLRSTPKTYLMWNPNTIKSLSKLQKTLVASALEILKPNGTLVYSTCTHAPEENEAIVDYLVKNFPNIKTEKISLPIKFRQGINEWNGEKFSKEVNLSCRIYPQDNNTEGFFVAKFRKIK